MITVTRPSGLLEPFDPPELTMEASIDRSMEVRDGLYQRRETEYLPTRPVLTWPATQWAFYSQTVSYPPLTGLPAL